MVKWFLDNKILLGSVFMVLGVFGQEVLIGIWAVSAWWLPKAITTANWIGLVLGGTGLAHFGVNHAIGRPHTGMLANGGGK